MKKCLLFHKYKLVKDTGNRYYICQKCGDKIVKVTSQGYQPISFGDWRIIR